MAWVREGCITLTFKSRDVQKAVESGLSFKRRVAELEVAEVMGRE